ncbi:MAG: hypothetical protein GY755_20050 [Chloroflexi bacterium]|nr:hypothetical protein [Chloroflexota bacterium]
MDILGIGIPELFFVILIAIIVLGPKDMQKAGKTIGKWMRKVIMSPEWREIKDASNRIKSIPNQLMREANLDDLEEYKRDLGITTPEEKQREKVGYGAWDDTARPQESEKANSIAPPTNTQNNAPSADEKPAPVKKADSSKKTHPINPPGTNNA